MSAVDYINMFVEYLTTLISTLKEFFAPVLLPASTVNR